MKGFTDSLRCELIHKRNRLIAVHVQDGDSEKRAKALFENHPTHDISVTSDSSVTSKKSAQA